MRETLCLVWLLIFWNASHNDQPTTPTFKSTGKMGKEINEQRNKQKEEETKKEEKKIQHT